MCASSYWLAIAGRTQEKLDRVKEELGDSDTFTFAADLRREEEVQAMVDGVLAWSGGRIDGLVNNAGGQFPAQLKDISLNGWNAVVNNNMTATFLVSKAVYLGSMEKHGGAIVNVGDAGAGVDVECPSDRGRHLRDAAHGAICPLAQQVVARRRVRQRPARSRDEELDIDVPGRAVARAEVSPDRDLYRVEVAPLVPGD